MKFKKNIFICLFIVESLFLVKIANCTEIGAMTYQVPSVEQLRNKVIKELIATGLYSQVDSYQFELQEYDQIMNLALADQDTLKKLLAQENQKKIDQVSRQDSYRLLIKKIPYILWK